AGRLRELIEEPRLTHPRLADHCGHLPVPTGGEFERAAEVLHLGVAADELSQPAPGRCLEAGPGRTRSRQLVDVDGIGESLYRYRAEGRHCDIAFHQFPG